MKLGMTLPQTGGDGSPEAIARAAKGAEEVGLDSLWVLDRLLRPVQPLPVRPGAEPRPLPQEYANVFDPIETLTFAAAHTNRVTLGTSVINALFHPPVVLARRLATLDQLSGGRVIAGLGLGWMPEEHAITNAPMSKRGTRMEEFVATLRAIWSDDPVSVDGRYYQIPASDIGPKPVQPEGIPIILGGYARTAIERAGRIADGFNPNASSVEQVAGQIAIFRQATTEADRDPDSLQVVVRGHASPTDEPENAGRDLFSGSIDQIADDLKRIEELDGAHIFLGTDLPLDRELELMSELRSRVD